MTKNYDDAEQEQPSYLKTDAPLTPEQANRLCKDLRGYMLRSLNSGSPDSPMYRREDLRPFLEQEGR
jgi:hypothetical protein